MVVSFSTLAGGVFVEAIGAEDHVGRARCFRFDSAGRAEYALHKDLTENGNRARWFGHVFTAKDFVFC